MCDNAEQRSMDEDTGFGERNIFAVNECSVYFIILVFSHLC